MTARTLPQLGGYPNNGTGNKGPDLKSAALRHGALLHPEQTTGRVSIAHKTPSGGWRERSYRVDQLPDVMAAIAGENDAYISQQRFECRRLLVQLWQLGAMYVDLDYHKVSELAGMHPMGVLDDVLVALERTQLPAPTLAMASGRGLYVIWLHSPVPRKALPRWNACQKELWRVLKRFGADRGALDAARVLRVAGTINGKSGAVVEQIAPVGDVWDFETLAAEVLPLDRGEVRDLRIARAARRPSERLVVPPEGFTPGTLWAGRLTDLQRLRGIRFLGDLPPGQRDPWMFIAGVAMSWLTVNPQALDRELRALAKEAAGWRDEESSRRLQAIMKRARMAARGEHVDWDGRMVDPRYYFKNQTIIEWLEITADEERDMQVLISSDEARRRDTEQQRKRRREAGMVSRDEYLEGTLAREREPIIARLRDEEGMSLRQISRETGVPLKEVHRLSKRLENRIDKGCSQCVGLYGGVASPEGGITGSSELRGSPEVRGGIGEEKEKSPPPHNTGRVVNVTPSRNASTPTPTTENDVPNVGRLVVAEFRSAEDHPLGCGCQLCSVPTPRYVGGAS